MSVRSMTGFARVSRACAGGDLILSIKGVNHRGLDLHFHLPPEFDTIEPAIRARIKPRVGRGHLLVVINYSRAGVDGHAVPVLNRPLFDSWLAAFREASTTSGSDALPDIASALRLPGMLHASTTGQALTGEAETAVMTALDEALQAFNAEREREGAALCAELESRSRTVQDLAARIEAIRAGATAALQKRLRARLSELLKNTAVDPQRIVQEAAILADRSDIAEEILRLKTHAAQLDELLAADGEKGKRLDFLLQEMNREANTILSKTSGLGEMGLAITDLALAAKSEIDKIREQSLNVE